MKSTKEKSFLANSDGVWFVVVLQIIIVRRIDYLFVVLIVNKPSTTKYVSYWLCIESLEKLQNEEKRSALAYENHLVVFFKIFTKYLSHNDLKKKA